jgi:hypothetical protein
MQRSLMEEKNMVSQSIAADADVPFLKEKNESAETDTSFFTKNALMICTLTAD